MTKPHMRSSLTIILFFLAACSAKGVGTGGGRDTGDGGSPASSGGSSGPGGPSGSGGSSSGTGGGAYGSGGMAGAGGKAATGGISGSGGGPGFGGSTATKDASPGSDALASTLEATQACRAAITALVERSNFCFGYDVGYSVYLDACPDYYFSADSNRTVAEVADCIPQIKSQPCSELDINIGSPPCLLGGKRPASAGCRYSSQCQSNFCQGAISGCGFCRDGNFLPGATCDRGQCQPGDTCDESVHKCVSRSTFVYAAEGEPCHNSKTSTVICQGDLHCTNVGTTTMLTCQSVQRLNCGLHQCDAASYCSDSTAGTCAPSGKLGDICNDVGGDGVPPCDDSLHCWNGKCTKRRLAGETCDNDLPCSELYDCVNGACQLRVCPA